MHVYDSVVTWRIWDFSSSGKEPWYLSLNFVRKCVYQYEALPETMGGSLSWMV